MIQLIDLIYIYSLRLLIVTFFIMKICFLVAARDHFTSDGSCHAGIISYDVSLRGGMSAGKFTPHGKVANMETCIGLCCQSKNCSLAMMLKDACFTVVCKNDQLCEKKQAMTSSKFNPRVAYVFRSKKTISDDGKSDYL